MTEWLARTLANATLVSCLSLAAVLLYQALRKNQRNQLSITGTAILLLGAVIAWFAIPHYQYGWIAGAILTVLLAAGTYYQAGTLQDRTTRRMFQAVLGICLLCTPIVPYWQYRSGSDPSQGTTAASANQKALDIVSTSINKESDTVLQNVQDLAKADYFAKAAADGTLAGTGIDLQRFMLEKGLSSLAVTNGQGMVIIRPNQPGVTGDSLYTTSPWTVPAYDGQAVSGLAVDDQGIPTASAAIPFGGTSTNPQYVLIASKSLNEDFLQNLKGGLGSGVAITPSEGLRSFVTGDPVERPLYQNAALTSDLRATMRDNVSHNDYQPLLTSLELDGVRYVATTIPLHTLSGGGVIGATVLHRDQAALAWPLLLLLGISVLIVLGTILPTAYSFLMSHRNKKRTKKTGAHSHVMPLLPLLLALPLLLQSGLSALTMPALLGRSTEGTTTRVQSNEPGPTAFLTFGRLNGPDQSLALGQSERLPVRVDSGGGNVGEVHAVVYYQPDRITVNSVLFDGSFCTTSSQEIDGRAGKVTINCTAPSPSFSGQIGTVATLQIVARQSGSALFWYDSLTSKVTGYSSDPRPLLAGARPTTIDVSGTISDAPSIASPTHPLLSGCQKNSTAELHWTKAQSVRRFEYAWTEQSPTDSPNQSTVSTSLNLPVKLGTTHWLSLRAIKEDGTKSAVSHYRVDGCTP